MKASANTAGFTLIEMLVVLAIFGVVAGLSVLGMRTGPRDTVRREADILARRITIAADQALVTDQPATIRWDSGGYAIGDAPPATGNRHALPDGVALSAEGARSSTVLALDTGPIDIRLADRSGTWVVRFDGLNAIAEAAR